MKEAAFKSTLSDDELIALGRLTRNWALVEEIVNLIIVNLLRLQSQAAQDLLLTPLQIGKKCEIIKSFMKPQPDSPLKNDLKDLCDLISKTASKRNFAIHGVWATYQHADGKKEPAAYSFRNPQNPLFPSELEGIADIAAEISEKSYRIYHKMTFNSDDDLIMPADYVFGDEVPADPQSKHAWLFRLGPRPYQGS